MNSKHPRPFRNREHAGRVLAERLKAYANRSDVVVLALPRGGVPVAVEVAAALRAPAAETCDEFRDEVDEIVCATTPDPFYAVGLWYEDSSQTTDEEVRDLLARSFRELVNRES